MCVVVVVAAVTRVAIAQPSAQPAAPPPAGPAAPTGPTDSPPPQPDAGPPPVQVQPPVQTPPATPSVYAQCMEQRHRLSAAAAQESDLQERTRLLQSMPECNTEMNQLPSSQPSGDSDEDSPMAAGFALELHLETGQVFIDSNSILPVMQSGVFFGHHGGKLTIGVSIDVSRLTSSQSNSGLGDESFTSVLVMPGIRATLARSADQRTEMIGDVDLGYGASWESNDMSPSDPPAIQHLRFQIAPGLRYWLSRSFAVGGAAGLRYDRQSRDSSDGTSSTALTNTGVFGSLALTGVF